MSEELLPILRKFWGYDSFRPLQAEAMSNVLHGRDSVVVLPTGGGKSLCYQVPAVGMPGVAVVVSPLLSLMKDQTDALRQCGVPAGCLNSMQSPKEQSDVVKQLRANELKLLYVAPERLASSGFVSLMREIRPSFFAIDEAHCISSWGHEFRPDYLKLSILRELFPKATITALTATATQRVRADIVRQLKLRDPDVLVGSFDRPNLTYRVERRSHDWRQYCEVIERHRGESGIIYCISKRKVDDLSAALREAGYKALPYHAGMDSKDRQRNQDAFIRERVDIIVATVAFGMGIDKSNVRYVMHAQAPKTIENYQQEAGRAGRDGLPSECVLLWTKGDFGLWRRIISELDDEARGVADAKLSQLSRYCEESVCRHRALVQYFGQTHDKGKCGACDHCLGESQASTRMPKTVQLVPVDDSLTVAQKILSCVVRLGGAFPARYMGQILVGSKDKRIAESGHDNLTTYGILSSEDQRDIRAWIGQLATQECLELTPGGEVARVTHKGRSVLRGEVTPRLDRMQQGVSASGQTTGLVVDPRLFEELRTLRWRIADERNVAAFVVFSDATLTELAARRPGSVGSFMQASGVGETKAMQYGRRFVECITSWCSAMEMPTDVPVNGVRWGRSVNIPPEPLSNFVKKRAFEMFKRGDSINDVVVALTRARSTVAGYLTEFIERERIESPDKWVDAATVAKVEEAASRLGSDLLRPIFDDLGGVIDYEPIRIVLGCLRNAASRESNRLQVQDCV